MGDKEKILAEIERLKEKYRHGGIGIEIVRIETLNEVRDFICCLPDLEKEIRPSQKEMDALKTMVIKTKAQDVGYELSLLYERLQNFMTEE